MRVHLAWLKDSRLLLSLALALSATSCSQESRKSSAIPAPTPCGIALAPLEGKEGDGEIARLQRLARTEAHPASALEQLGQRFVAKARTSNDPFFYKLAEQCALCLESQSPGNPQALLLRGHALHQMHRFKEAEALGRQAVAKRGGALDYGLLGDALMEQGRLDEAAAAYQKMMDIKPFYQSYARAAHIRWLVGDLPGAAALMDMAAKAANAQDPESVAWAYSRLALYSLQAGAHRNVTKFTGAALGYVKDYPLALFVRGRALLAQGKIAEAVEPLQRAAQANRIPEYQWVLIDVLEAAGRGEEARRIDEDLMRAGEATDRRTFALYLATRGRDPEKAVRLARSELEVRSDILTWDALAWALAAAGQVEEAQMAMKRALAAGTKDARLFFHAGLIARRAGRIRDAQRWLNRAQQMQQMLLPSEKKYLPHEPASGTAKMKAGSGASRGT